MGEEHMYKICFVTTISTTIKAFLLEFADYLTNNCDFDVTFICNTDPQMQKFCNSKIHYIPVPMKRGFGYDGLKVINQLTKIFKEQNFDIVQYSTPNAALYASIASKMAGIKVRLYCQWGIRYMGMSGIGRFLMKAAERITCNCSTYIESESHSLMKFSLSEGLYSPNRACVIWNGSVCGVNLNKFQIKNREKWRREFRLKLNIADDDIVFGYVGRITRDKGINELLESFKSVLSEKKAKLLLVGDFDNEGTIRQDLREWAQSNKNVIFVGWTNEVAKYYCAMDVFMSLSYREGFGLVVIEAAAMGLPGIVTDVPGQIDTIEDFKTGIQVPAKKVQPVITAITYYIEHPHKIKEMGVQARKNVEDNFNQQGLFERLTKNRILLIKNS